MRKLVIATVVTAVGALTAPAAHAVPFVDFGLGIGQFTLDEDESGAVMGQGVVGIDIPGSPVNVEGHFATSISDGEEQVTELTNQVADYSADQIGIFATISSPGPIYVKGKVGATRTGVDSELDDSTTTEPAYGLGVGLSDWEFEWTRTTVDTLGVERDVDYLTITYRF